MQHQRTSTHASTHLEHCAPGEGVDPREGATRRQAGGTMEPNQSPRV